MILPDVNLLVYAYRVESPDHASYSAWLTGVVRGGDELALCDVVLSGFVRIVTNARIFADPAPAADALHFVHRLTAGPRCRWLPAGPEVWNRLGDLVSADPLVKGNHIPDAYLAAMALTHNARLATRDRGFARYPALRHYDPLTER